DLLDGGDHADSLRGDAGNDTLIGGMGNDTLIGSWDSDRLIGGTGRDRLTGGKGADSFVFTYPADSRTGAMRDIITDLRSGVDMIDLTAITEGTAMTGNFTGNQAGAFAVWYVVRGDDLLLRADTTGDGAADFVLTLTGVDHLGASDILL
ncbi:MAG: M10 family metallopeptidase C-terminal domain-containing protein, partial [Paracoccus sp. (in: a-proteobacteria)]|nr:M10 family metallopeptidase C-terminal domain-containing protein [Paracoccus sp. (in: a-proteobacteria)]